MTRPEPILIVDDDSLSRRLLCRSLEDSGLHPIECPDGMEALQVLEQTGARLVVLDYEMPILNGAQIAEIIRGNPNAAMAETPIILLTAHSNTEHEVECLRAGVNDFVTKPVNTAVLKARIETQLRLHDLRRQLQEQNRELERWRATHELDLEAARLTQQAVLPPRMPILAGWEFAAYYRPLIQVGGDMYDWLRIADNSLLLWVADATGHGASAALITALTKSLFRSGAADQTSPAAILKSVAENFHAVFKGKSFMTAACCALQAGAGKITFSGAGHPPLLIARQNRAIETLRSASPPLGLDASGTSIQETSVELGIGDALLLYTDGLYGVSNKAGKRSTPEDLQAAIQPPGRSIQEFLDSILNAVTERGALSDDVAAFAAVRRG